MDSLNLPNLQPPLAKLPPLKTRLSSVMSAIFLLYSRSRHHQLHRVSLVSILHPLYSHLHVSITIASQLLLEGTVPIPSVAKLPEQREDDMNSITTVKGHEDFDIQPPNSVIACCEKGSDGNNTANDLILCPTGCSEQFLTEIVDVEAVDLDFSFDSTIGKSECKDQPTDDVACTKEVLVLEQGHSSRIAEETAVVPVVISRQTDEVHKESMLVNVSLSEADIIQDDGVSDDHCPKIGPELPLDHDLANQDEEDSLIENVETGEDAPFNQSSRLLSESTAIGKEDENFVEATGTTFTERVLKKVQNDLKTFQHRGARRRCLQFEDSQHKVISNEHVPNPSYAERENSLSLETQSMPTNGEHDDVIQPMLYPRNSLNPLIMIPKPSGIGLHLNSIVNTSQGGSDAIINVKAAQLGESRVGKNFTPVFNSHLTDYSDNSPMLPLSESALVTADDSKHGSHASEAADLAMAMSTHITEPSNDPVALNSKANQSTPGNDKRQGIEQGGRSEELTNLCSKKKRMKSVDSSDGDGCKRCNCKRSKCLKLYCDCFAAGIYCADTCACQECFNRPDYEDTVLETRQKIESRDPFAFAPKVVESIIEQPASSFGEDGTHFTPASARHKKGCKCKKSMCLKSTSNVGCSDGCRCEGCKNIYGRKGEYGMANVVLTREDKNEPRYGSFAEKCEMVASGSAIQTAHGLTPTPSVQFSNYAEDASKAWFQSYLHSPESGSTYVISSPVSPRNTDTSVMISGNIEEIPHPVPFDQESHHGNANTVNEFPEARPQSGNTGLDFGATNLQKWVDNLKPKSVSANRNYFSEASRVGRGSPITPMAQFSGSVLQEVDSSSIVRDDTPEILKDASIPLNTVKAISPDKKRASPPHGNPYEFSSSSSAGIQTGRKFILKAVPSFPSLTPCIDSKTSDVQQSNYPENCSVNK